MNLWQKKLTKKTNASRFDEATQSNVRMTRSECFTEKSEQGKSVGNRVALDMMVPPRRKNRQRPQNTP